MIKYLGSKRKLLPKIIEIIKNEKAEAVLDLFSGTSRVGHALQNEGIEVVSNDINSYSYHIAKTYVEINKDEELVNSIKELIDEFNNLNPKQKPGWFTKTYCQESRFFQEKNGLKIEAIREAIQEYNRKYWCLDPGKKRNMECINSALLVSLIEAADRIDSTCGIQMAYLKNWSKRSYNDLSLRVPDFSKGNGLAICGDARDAANIKVDLAYIDPPYNQHSYLGNYHIWETVCLWDKPEIYGKAKKRIDVRSRKSNWNSKKMIKDEFKAVIDNLSAPKALISFNNEGHLTKDDISEILETKFNEIDIIEVPYQRYVGAKIGIHNNKGEKVGKISHTTNKELLFLAKTPVLQQ